MKTKLVWFIPLFSALAWGSCYNPDNPEHIALSQSNRDIRCALTAFSWAMVTAIVIRDIQSKSKH